jgi:putative transposase
LNCNDRRKLIDFDSKEFSIRRQCDLLDLNRSTIYYNTKDISEEDLLYMNLIDEEFTRHPFYGTRRMTVYLNNLGHQVNRKRTQRLYQHMGLEAVYPKPNLSKKHPKHAIYPYLLKNLAIKHVDQVWSADITYVRLTKGFVYLFAIIDWYSRYVVDWEISTTLDADFCINTLSRVLEKSKCNIFNTDQGVQFTSDGFTSLLKANQILISMDGRGRALDNIFVERLWRSLKYELIYLIELCSPNEARKKIGEYFQFYNTTRPHQSLDYKTPQQIYCAA